MEDNIVEKFIWDSTMGEPQFILPISVDAQNHLVL